MTQDPFYDSQSAVYPEAAAPKKRVNTWVIVLIVVAVVLLCCCVIGVAGWFLGDSVVALLREMGVDLGLWLALQ
jgi:membrane protein YdbS with pleckstrin-like domain